MMMKQNKPVIAQAKIGSYFCVSYYNDKKYYLITDVASWNQCGHVKTILTMEIIVPSQINKVKKMKSLITLKDHEQLIIKFAKTYAIYTINVHRQYQNDEKIASIGVNKLPNLHHCRCGA